MVVFVLVAGIDVIEDTIADLNRATEHAMAWVEAGLVRYGNLRQHPA